MQWYDFIGYLGALLIVGSYLLLQIEKINSQNFLYSLANLFGAAFILVSLCFDFNLSAAIVESMWLVASAIGLRRNFKKPSYT